MKNFFLKNPVRALTGLSIILVAPVMAITAFAQQGAGDQSTGFQAPTAPVTGITTLNGVFGLIDNVFNILFWLLIALAAIFIIWAAFGYLTAGGDPENVQKANHRVIYAVVAVVVGVLAKAIPSIVCTFIASSCTTSQLTGLGGNT